MNLINKKSLNSIMIITVLFGMSFHLAIAESANAIVKIKATVVAGCTFDSPNTVTLDNIPSSEFNNKLTGDYLDNYAKDFNLVATCSGTDKYKYTFKINEADDSCIKTDADFMRYCLRIDDQYLDLSSTSSSITRNSTQDGKTTTIMVVPQVASTEIMPVGDVNGQITITIEPM